jgi:hypothetical protein
VFATSATNRNSYKNAIKKSWVFAMGSMKASSSHILCCSQQPKKKKKKLVNLFFGVTGIFLGWEEFSISRVDDSQRMREKKIEFVNYRVDDRYPYGDARKDWSFPT